MHICYVIIKNLKKMEKTQKIDISKFLYAAILVFVYAIAVL